MDETNWTPEEVEPPTEPAEPISLQDVFDMDPMEAVAQVFQDPVVVTPPPDFTASTDVSMDGYTGMETQLPSFERFSTEQVTDNPSRQGDLELAGQLRAHLSGGKIETPVPADVPRRQQLRDEQRRQQDARVEIRREQKAGNSEAATRLADIERRARDAGSTTPLDDELAVAEAFPFDAIPEREQPEQEPTKTDPGDAAKVAELRRTPVPLLTDYVGGNPAWDMGGEGVVEVLKEMVAVLKRIDDKLPQKATYSE